MAFVVGYPTRRYMTFPPGGFAGLPIICVSGDRPLIARLVICLLLGCASAAVAQDPDAEQAKALYSNGKMLFDEGRYEDALFAWQKAYELSERPLLLYNIALAQEALGDLKAAIDGFYKYRVFAPKDEQEALQAKIEELKQKIADLPPEPEPELQPEPTPVASAPVESTVVVPKKPNRVGAYALWGGTAVTLSTGVIFGLQASSQNRALKNQCNLSSQSGRTLCMSEVEDDYKRLQTTAALADISWALTAALGGTALYLTIKKPRSQGATQAGLEVTPNQLSIRGRF